MVRPIPHGLTPPSHPCSQARPALRTLELRTPPHMLPEDAVSALSLAVSTAGDGEARCRNLRTAVLLGACHPRVGAASPLQLLPLPLLHEVLELALPLGACHLDWHLQEWMPGGGSSSSSSSSGGSSSSSDSEDGSSSTSSSDGGSAGNPAGQGSSGGRRTLVMRGQGRGRGGRGGGRGGGRRGSGRGGVPGDLQAVMKWV